MASCHLSDELKTKLGTKRRSITVRKGDRVKVMRGERRGHAGKVMEADLSTLKIYVEGVTRRNAKGVEKLIAIDPSNLMIMEGEFTKDRLEAVKRSGSKKQ